MNKLNNKKLFSSRNKMALGLFGVTLATPFLQPANLHAAGHNVCSQFNTRDARRTCRRNRTYATTSVNYNTFSSYKVSPTVYRGVNDIKSFFNELNSRHNFRRNISGRTYHNYSQIGSQSEQLAENLKFLTDSQYQSFQKLLEQTFNKFDNSKLNATSELYSPITIFNNYFNYMNLYQNSFKNVVANFNISNFRNSDSSSKTLTQGELNRAMDAYRQQYKWANVPLSSNFGGQVNDSKLSLLGVKQVGDFVVPVISGVEDNINSVQSAHQYFGPAYVNSSTNEVLRTIIPGQGDNDNFVLPFMLSSTSGDLDTNSKLYQFVTLDNNGTFIDENFNLSSTHQVSNVVNGEFMPELANVNITNNSSLMFTNHLGNHASETSSSFAGKFIAMDRDLQTFANENDQYRDLKVYEKLVETYNVVVQWDNDNTSRKKIATITKVQYGNIVSFWSFNQEQKVDDLTGTLHFNASGNDINSVTLSGISATNSDDKLTGPILSGSNFVYNIASDANVTNTYKTVYHYSDKNSVNGVVRDDNFGNLNQSLINGYFIDFNNSTVKYDNNAHQFIRQINLTKNIVSVDHEIVHVQEKLNGVLDSKDVSTITRDLTTYQKSSLDSNVTPQNVQSSTDPQLRVFINETQNDYTQRMLRLGYNVLTFESGHATLQKVGVTNQTYKVSSPWILNKVSNGEHLGNVREAIVGNKLSEPSVENGYSFAGFDHNNLVNNQHIIMNINSAETDVKIVGSDNDVDALMWNNQELTGKLIFGHDANGNRSVSFKDNSNLSKYYNVAFKDATHLIFTPKVTLHFDANSNQLVDENGNGVTKDKELVFSFVNSHKIFEVSIVADKTQTNYDISSNVIREQINVENLLHGDFLSIN